MRDVLVVGAGAVGGWIGGVLVEAGRDVTFLVRSGRADQIARDGLRLRTDDHERIIDPRIVTADRLDRKAGLILLSVKGQALSQAIEDLAPAVGDETLILPVLNGMRHMDALDARFGRGRVLGGVCRVFAALDQDGGVVQRGAMRQLVFGARDPEAASSVEGVLETFSGIALEAAWSDQIERDMWEKWVQLASAGAITTMFGSALGNVAQTPGGADLSRQIVEECAAAASAGGHPIRPEVLDQFRGFVSDPSSTMTSSLYRDMKNNAPVEVEEILGDLVGHADQLGADVPLLRAALLRLRIYQRSLAS